MNLPRQIHYLDANATEPMRPEARTAMLAALRECGNPSSVHAAGRAARARLEHARQGLAEMFGAQADNVIFTSGGTESNALAVHGLASGRVVLAGATEHDAILQATPTPLRVPVRPCGMIDLDQLDAMLGEHRPALVCVMLANNETGVINPVADVAALCRAHDALLHVDAVQAAGRIDFRLDSLGATSIAISSHKFGGPTGTGALLLAGDDTRRLAPLMAGGGQERGRRGGTQATALITGMHAALLCARQTDWAAIALLRNRVEDAARAASAIVCGEDAPRLPNTTCLALPGAAAQTQLITLDLEGYCVSAGSACSSGKVTRSHVIDAMGMGALSQQAIRVSLPWNITVETIDAFIAAYRAMAARLCRTTP